MTRKFISCDHFLNLAYEDKTYAFAFCRPHAYSSGVSRETPPLAGVNLLFDIVVTSALCRFNTHMELKKLQHFLGMYSRTTMVRADRLIKLTFPNVPRIQYVGSHIRSVLDARLLEMDLHCRYISGLWAPVAL